MKALIVGFGSIGARHGRLLHDLGCKVALVSRRPLPNPGFPVFTSLVAAMQAWDPGYVVIATETARHAETLDMLTGTGFAGVALVEKPLFAPGQSNRHPPGFAVVVGYNLRFHPLLRALRKALAGQRILTAEIRCGSFLPDWRPGRDYRTTASARAEAGGGVLTDLSHEIDYALWLLGPWRRLAALGGQIGGLPIDSDDAAGLLAEFENCPVATFLLSYLDRPAGRTIRITTGQGTYLLDFLAGTLTGPGGLRRQAVVEPDATYLAQHRAVLEEGGRLCCSLAEGAAVGAFLSAAAAALKDGAWKTAL